MNRIGFLIFFSLFVFLNFYVFIRGWQALPNTGFIHAIYTVLFLLFSLSFFIAVFLEGKIPHAIIAVAENMGGFWMVTFLYFVVMALLGDFLRLGNHFFGIFPDKMTVNYSQAKLIYFGTVMLILAVFSVIGYIRFSNPKTVNLSLDIHKNGTPGTMSVVAVSDIHLGNMIRRPRLEKYVELINKQNPDLILIAGDLFDRNLHSVKIQKMDQVLSKLKAKHGVYAVLGNHDYFGNVNQAIDIINRSGIKLLRDSAVTIDNHLHLIGRDDRTNSRRKPLKHIISDIRGELPTLLMDHQPANLKEAVENNIDVQISGHTHNGQIYPINRIVAKIYELAYGYRKTGKTHFYVSSGLGLWGAPIRLGTQSEIVRMKLNFIPAN